MNFRKRADMYICAPKVQLAHYVDNTMPRRDWSRYDEPSYLRKERALAGEHKRVSKRETQNLFLQLKAG